MSKSFYDFMASRQRAILNGTLGSEPGTYKLAGEHRLAVKLPEITAKSRVQQFADRSDPFTAARAFNNFSSGIAELDDYHGEAHVHEIPAVNFLDGSPSKMRETEWRNRRVPCI